LEDSEVDISVAEDLADYRVGVQSGTVYEDWVEENLVETGLMRQRNVHVYAETSNMITDLDEGFVDVLLIDKQPAETAVESGPYRIVSSGLQRQLFAIAVPRGSTTLLGSVNQALLDMQADGTLYDFIEHYVGIPEEEIPEFPPIDEIEPIPPTESECVNGLGYISDLSFDDQGLTNIQSIPAGTAFQKGWRLENTGTCTWTPSYTMVYVAGNSPLSRMGGQPTAVGTSVAPGQQYDMWIDLVSPAYPGTYVGYWQMTTDQGLPFGQRVWAAITVPSSATPTPLPTQTPSAEIQFAANPEAINRGQCSTLSWNSANVKEVYVYPQGENWQNYGVPGTGQQTVCPSTTTTYEMRVVKLDNSVEVRNATVHVTPTAPGAPVITRFTAEPTNIFVGQCVTIQWVVDGQVDRVILSRNETVLKDPAPVSGSLVDCPPVGGQTYLLRANGPGGTASATDYVTVSESATPAPTATPTVPAPDPPVVNYFDANPKQIEVSQCTTLSWGVGGGTTSVQIKRDSSVILDNAKFEGTLVDCPTAAATYRYSVEARNNAGATDSASQDVIVSDSIPENPLVGTNWTLSAIGQGVIPPNISITLSFSSQSQLNGFGGCNSYSANYQVNGSNLSISGFRSTRTSCGEDIDNVESLYFASLQGATSYQLDEQRWGSLTI
jgi:heat shock protein HslJ